MLDPRFVSNFAIYHQRYSTNTFPTWQLAQPFRVLAHNGEINTLKGNLNWMKAHETRMDSPTYGGNMADVKPVIQPGGSDSAMLDNVFEALVGVGRNLPMVKTLMIPDAWSGRKTMPETHRNLYSYCNSVMEPWDGPAAIAAYAGDWVIGGMDRNGLRPMRYTVTNDGLVIAGSETGMAGVRSPLDGSSRIHSLPRTSLPAGAAGRLNPPLPAAAARRVPPRPCGPRACR